MRVQDKRRGRSTIAVTCAMAATVAVVVTGCSDGGSDGSEGAASTVTPSVGPTSSETAEAVEAVETVQMVGAIDTSNWTTYTSDVYDLQIGHPSGWTELPATRAWRLDTDGADPLSPAHEAFRSPEGDVRVSVWAAPLDPSTREETTAYLESWVEDYCEATENLPCTDIGDRAVELCLEKRDCHPGLLVPFESDVQAFFSGGDYASDAMTVVVVWRPESDASVVPYGGAQRLLEAFLSTMDVRPKP